MYKLLYRKTVYRIALPGWLLVAVITCCTREPVPGRETASTVVDTTAEAASKLYTLYVGDVKLKVEIAQDPESLEKGLMFRRNLPENQGMLFVFPYERILSFWMRNTYIPLDIAFIDAEGRIIDIQYMEPLDESRQYVSSGPALYALEVNHGWFERHGIDLGTKVIF
jgi:uncharacterized membrane protein (UPF0127 family)